MKWIHENWSAIAEALGVLYVVLNIVNARLDHPGPAKTWVGAALDAIAFLTRRDSPGTLKAPGKASVDPNLLQHIAAEVQP